MAKRRGRKRKVKLPLWLSLSILLIGVLVFGILYLTGVITIEGLPKLSNQNKKDDTTVVTTTNNTTTNQATTTIENINLEEGIIYDDFQIHFMMLNNSYAGDSIYIKAGENDILIDAGSNTTSYSYTSNYIDNYCKDKKLEFVVATHGDKDHIACFPKFCNDYKIDTIIYNGLTHSESKTYTNMISAFNNEVETDGAKIRLASDCFNNTNGAQSEYQLSDKVKMTILYNYYYFHNTTEENDYSVCLLFTYTNDGDYHYFLLTGDLEEAGEKKLSEYYDGSTKEKTLPHVDLFKAGHHGSKTSSNDVLLEKITPAMCVVCCCCGTDEYTGITDNQFPTQEFINRIAKWTEDVYVTTVCDSFEILTAKQDVDSETGELKFDKYGNPVSDKKGVSIGKQYIHSSGYKALNGNIVVSCCDLGIGLACSNNNTKLKDSAWFNQEIVLNGVTRTLRTWPTN